jgi:hypothetical protein
MFPFPTAKGFEAVYEALLLIDIASSRISLEEDTDSFHLTQKKTPGSRPSWVNVFLQKNWPVDLQIIGDRLSFSHTEARLVFRTADSTAETRKVVYGRTGVV